MKNIIYTLLLGVCIFSCSEGDIITTEFSFDKDSLDLCEATTDNFIYFKINNSEREGVSFNFTSTTFTENTEDSLSITLNGTNRFIIRKFNTQIDRDYYCGLLPPSDVQVIDEFIGASGTAGIKSEITDQTEVIDNDTITVTQNTYQTTITFTNLKLNGNEESFVYENLVLEGNRVINDTIVK